MDVVDAQKVDVSVWKVDVEHPQKVDVSVWKVDVENLKKWMFPFGRDSVRQNWNTDPECRNSLEIVRFVRFSSSTFSRYPVLL